MAERRRRGKLELAVARQVKGLRESDETVSEPLSELALKLAATLDSGAGLATAAVARELRHTLEALTPRGRDDGDDEFDGWLSGLSEPEVVSSEVGDT